MEKKRRAELSYMNVLFCVLVILIHIISYPVSELTVGSFKYSIVMLVWRFISFVVQGFVFLAGVKLFLNGKDSLGYAGYLKRRLPAILIPYLVSYVAYYIFYFAVYDYPIDAGFILKHLFFGSLVSHLYFVPLILQFDLLYPFWKRIIDRCSPLLVVPFTLVLSLTFESNLPSMVSAVFPGVNIIYNDRLFTTYLAFWIIGCYVGRNYEAFCALMKKNFGTVCAIFGFASVVCGVYSYLAFCGIAYIPNMSYLHSIYVICAIIFVFALSLRIDGKYSQIKLIRAIDGASYYIYLWHMLALFLANFVLKATGVAAQAPAFIIRAVVTYGVTIAVASGYVVLKKKIKNVKKSAS